MTRAYRLAKTDRLVGVGTRAVGPGSVIGEFQVVRRKRGNVATTTAGAGRRFANPERYPIGTLTGRRGPSLAGGAGCRVKRLAGRRVDGDLGSRGGQRRGGRRIADRVRRTARDRPRRGRAGSPLIGRRWCSRRGRSWSGGRSASRRRGGGRRGWWWGRRGRGRSTDQGQGGSRTPSVVGRAGGAECRHRPDERRGRDLDLGSAALDAPIASGLHVCPTGGRTLGQPSTS